MGYAGFWRRFGAMIVDSIVLTIGLAILGFILGAIGIPIFETADYAASTTGGLSADLSAEASLSPVAAVILFLVNLLYFPIFECSALQATPGKLALGIKVTDGQGNRVGFWRAFARNLAKIVSAVILYIGFIMAAFTARKQALHDMIAGCLVVAKAA